jgi:hypothetical protein
MNKNMRKGLVAFASLGVARASLIGGGAQAKVVASSPWHGSSTSFNNGVVTLANTTLNDAGKATGTSYENDHLQALVANGSTITFEWRSSDVTCAGGTPRVFVQGGAYNTFDADPAGPGACGTDTDGDGWNTVVGTVTGVVAGPAEYTGIVNDNPEDAGTVQVRKLTIDGKLIDLKPAETVKGGGKK